MSHSYYRKNAEALSEQYNSLDPAAVHASWLRLLPDQPGLAADIGAGSGRDANWLASMGWDVVAVEPEEQFRSIAEQNSDPRVSWVDDKLPKLKKLRDGDYRFDLILVSAVWMHLSPNQREIAFRVLSDLLAPGGLLVITVRFEPDAAIREARGFYQVEPEELIQSSKHRALELIERVTEEDKLGRETVGWETLCFRLPDDGTGSLPLLRHIIVNDNKAASYKLGLLRTLIRIAEGAPGLVLRRDDDWVEIPFGAVGLYWIKLYAPAILKYDLPQHPNKNKGYGFAKADFKKLEHESSFDLRVGANLAGDSAKTVIGAIKAACLNIKDMPANHTTYPGGKEPVFECDMSSVTRSSSNIILNKEFLAGFGTFRIPAALWQTMGQYACWLEPAIVNEWVKLMQGYDEKRQGKQRDVRLYLRGMEWRQDKRDTNLARRRFSSLNSAGSDIHCTWSDKRLSQSNFVIDHCFPWSRWFNNDLWNLMPVTEKVNSKKGDKLPTAALLLDARARILEWWEIAYSKAELKARFMTEAEAALPLLKGSSGDFHSVFSAVMLQRQKIRANQQLEEWDG